MGSGFFSAPRSVVRPSNPRTPRRLGAHAYVPCPGLDRGPYLTLGRPTFIPTEPTPLITRSGGKSACRYKRFFVLLPVLTCKTPEPYLFVTKTARLRLETRLRILRPFVPIIYRDNVTPTTTKDERNVTVPFVIYDVCDSDTKGEVCRLRAEQMRVHFGNIEIRVFRPFPDMSKPVVLDRFRFASSY